MGNSESAEESSSAPNAMKFFHDYEHKQGTLLVPAIKRNSVEDLEKALEVARKEFARPKTTGFNKAQYEEMVTKMLDYLTQTYDIGEGILFKQTPEIWAKNCSANEATIWLKSKIEYFEKLKNSAPPPADSGSNSSSSSSSSSNSNGGANAESSSSDRAALAKERLKAFRQQGK